MGFWQIMGFFTIMSQKDKHTKHLNPLLKSAELLHPSSESGMSESSFDILRITNEGGGDPYQLLLSTASPNPGVSTIVSSSWTPPSFIKTFDCSTCQRRKNDRNAKFYFSHKLRL